MQIMESQFLERESVQHFLNCLMPGQSFSVIFVKDDGKQRVYSGNLKPSDNRSDLVPIETLDGWKSFRINRVLWIGFPDELPQSMKDLG
jgi:hypothetical protein